MVVILKMISSFLHNLNMFIYHITKKKFKKNQALLWDISSTLKGLSDTTSQRHHCALKPIISNGLRGATTVVCGARAVSTAALWLRCTQLRAQLKCVVFSHIVHPTANHVHSHSAAENPWFVLHHLSQWFLWLQFLFHSWQHTSSYDLISFLSIDTVPITLPSDSCAMVVAGSKGRTQTHLNVSCISG